MRRFIAAGAAVLAVTLAASSGVAHAAMLRVSCDQPSTQVFLGVDGDKSAYFLAPGGSFESGAPGWTLTGGAALAAGGATSSGGSLALPAGSSATSAPVCVGQLDPAIRLYVRNTGAASSRLGVTVLYTLPNGKQASHLVGAVTGSGTWSPTQSISFLKSVMTNHSATGTTDIAFVFAPLDSAGRWQIDDLWVDPLKHR